MRNRAGCSGKIITLTTPEYKFVNFLNLFPYLLPRPNTSMSNSGNDPEYASRKPTRDLHSEMLSRLTCDNIDGGHFNNAAGDLFVINFCDRDSRPEQRHEVSLARTRFSKRSS